MTFGRRPTLGFITTRASPSNIRQKDDCCKFAKDAFIDNFQEISKERLTELTDNKQEYVETWAEAEAYIKLIKESSCKEFKEMLKELTYETGVNTMKAHEILRNWKNCEKGTYDRDFQEINLSEDITIWQDSLYKNEDGRLTKKLYEIVRDEMYAPDVFSIDDLYEKVMARWDEVAKPTKEQVQKVMGYILTRGRIR